MIKVPLREKWNVLRDTNTWILFMMKMEILMYELEKLIHLIVLRLQSWIIKEEWFFDKHRSTMDVRIIGMCPVRTYIDKSTGEEEQNYFGSIFLNGEIY